MGKAKHNQAKSHFSYKNDEMDLVEIGQFLRDTTKYKVMREGYIVFDRSTGEYIGHQAYILENPRWKIRNPDLMLLDDQNKLVLIIELDGEIHDVKMEDTERRNKDYELAGLPFVTVSPLEIETNIFDLVTKKIEDKIG